MINTSVARRTILSRIEGSHPFTVPSATAAEYDSIVRAYKRTGQLEREQRLGLFEERLVEYDARVFRVTQATIASVIAAAIRERGAKRLLIPDELPTAWLSPEISFAKAGQLSHREMNSFDGIVSGCMVAIALTGTIILQNAPAQGPRRLSLIPDLHICVVFADQLVETVPEAFDRLEGTSTLPTTFISGPSATADIEMTRIKGVHGPRFLDVLIVS